MQQKVLKACLIDSSVFSEENDTKIIQIGQGITKLL